VPKTSRFGGKPVDLAAKFWPITGLIYVCRRELRSKKRLPFHPFSKKGELDVCKKLAGDKRDAEEEKATTLLNLRILENAARPNTRVMSSKKSHLTKHNVTHLPKNCIHLCG